jgi:dTDP-4-amino-4,6-dideoxygalactose transaminase
VKVPLLDLEAHNGPLRTELRRAFDRVLEANAFILGSEVDAFEEAVARVCEVPHAVGVSSGTDALLVALMALDIGPGDEVITTPFSFFATAGCIARLGAVPVFVDIEPDTFNIDPRLIAAAVTERTRAVLPVHLFGQPCDVSAIRGAAPGIPIVEDAAQALGARVPEGAVGSLGVAGCFSFFPSKNLGGFGDGGLVTTPDAAFAEKVRVLRGHGAQPKYYHALVGGNFRLDAIQAALLGVKLPHLDRWSEARRANAVRYDALFAEASLEPALLRTPARRYDGHVFNQYVIRSCHRDALARHLAAEGIGTAVYYPKPLHQQTCFAYLPPRPGGLPESEAAADEVLALPIYPELTESQLVRVAEAVTEFLGVRAANQPS